MELNHPGLPAGSVLVEIPEINRRQNHISQVDPNHTLLPISLDCLKDKESERPSTCKLCERVADLKGLPEYSRSMQDKDDVIASDGEENQQLKQQLREKDQLIRQLEERERQLRQMQQESDQLLRESRAQLQERDRQLGHVNQQLKASEQVELSLRDKLLNLNSTSVRESNQI